MFILVHYQKCITNLHSVEKRKRIIEHVGQANGRFDFFREYSSIKLCLSNCNNRNDCESSYLPLSVCADGAFISIICLHTLLFPFVPQRHLFFLVSCRCIFIYLVFVLVSDISLGLLLVRASAYIYIR